MTEAEAFERYRRDGSPVAFAALVEHHLNLVYSVAQRHVRSSPLAEDVAQAVFIELARNAATIKDGTPLVAWLHVVSRRLALNAARTEARRRVRERHAAEFLAMKDDAPDWSAIAPLLDEAVESLAPRDRAAVILRYLENKNLRDVGAVLGVSDDAAQKRVSRALDELRAFFARRGIAVTAAGLATALPAHASLAAPAGLGASIATTAATHIARHAALQAAATFTMTTLQKSLAGAALVAALGGVVFETTSLHAQRAELAALRSRNAGLDAQLQRLRPSGVAALRAATGPVSAPTAIPVSPADAALEAQMHAWFERAAQLRRLRDTRPGLLVPELALLSDEAWMQNARDAKLETEEQIRDAFAELRYAAERAFIRQAQRALRAYLEAHNGQLPAQPAELAASFNPPVDPRVLGRYTMLLDGNMTDASGERRNQLMALRAPLDWQRDKLWSFGVNNTSVSPAFDDHVRRAMKSFADTHAGVKPTLPEHIMSYLPAPVDPAKLKPFLAPQP